VALNTSNNNSTTKNSGMVPATMSLIGLTHGAQPFLAADAPTSKTSPVRDHLPHDQFVSHFSYPSPPCPCPDPDPASLGCAVTTPPLVVSVLIAPQLLPSQTSHHPFFFLQFASGNPSSPFDHTCQILCAPFFDLPYIPPSPNLCSFSHCLQNLNRTHFQIFISVRYRPHFALAVAGTRGWLPHNAGRPVIGSIWHRPTALLLFFPTEHPKVTTAHPRDQLIRAYWARGFCYHAS